MLLFSRCGTNTVQIASQATRSIADSNLSANTCACNGHRASARTLWRASGATAAQRRVCLRCPATSYRDALSAAEVSLCSWETPSNATSLACRTMPSDRRAGTVQPALDGLLFLLRQRAAMSLRAPLTQLHLAPRCQ